MGWVTTDHLPTPLPWWTFTNCFFQYTIYCKITFYPPQLINRHLPLIVFIFICRIESSHYSNLHGINCVFCKVCFNEPLTFLQRVTEELEYSDCLDKAARCESALEQMTFVAAFAVSSYATTAVRVTKPFNPLLGETYECDRRADYGWKCLTEQVRCKRNNRKNNNNESNNRDFSNNIDFNNNNNNNNCFV